VCEGVCVGEVMVPAVVVGSVEVIMVAGVTYLVGYIHYFLQREIKLWLLTIYTGHA